MTLVTAVGDEPGEAEAARAAARAEVEVHVADRRRPPPGLRRRRRQLRMAASWARGRWPWRTVWFAAPGDPGGSSTGSAPSASFDVVAVEDSAMSVFRYPPGCRPSSPTTRCCGRGRSTGAPGPPWRWPGWAFGELDWRRWARFQREAWRRFDRVQVFSRRDAERDRGAGARGGGAGAGQPLRPACCRRRPTRRARCPGRSSSSATSPTRPNRDAAIWLARRDHARRCGARSREARLRIVGSGAAAGGARAGRPAASSSSPTRPASARTSRRRPW